MRVYEILTEEQLDEINWRKGLATGALALGALGAVGQAQARVVPGQDPSINRLTGKPNVQQVDQTQQAPRQQAPSNTGFSKEYLEKVVNGEHPRPLISKEKAQELLKQYK